MDFFGTIDTANFLLHDTASNWGLTYGCWEVARSFYHALLKHGTFDEYHFFLWDKGQKVLSFLNNDKRAKLFYVSQLPLVLRETDYTVFFTQETALSTLVSLRSRFAKKYFPVCGVAHAISYAFFPKQLFLENLISDIQDFDSIICPSKALQEATAKLFELCKRIPSSGLKKRRFFKGRLDRIPLGIDAGVIRKINRSQAREKLGIPLKAVVICYFGRLSLYDKADLHPLLAVFKELKNDFSDIILLIGGSDAQGNYGAVLKKIAMDMGIASSIIFLLDKCVDTKHIFYSASDIFVSSVDNIQETFGLTPLEAMSCELPVVVSDWDGYREIIVHNKTGFLVPTYWADCDISDRVNPLANDWRQELLLAGQSVCVDKRSLKSHLSILIRDKNLRIKFGQAGRKHVVLSYDWSRVIPQYEALWRKLSRLAKRKKRKPRQDYSVFPQHYAEVFSHYPSRMLGASERLQITAAGETFLDDRKIIHQIPSILEKVIRLKEIYLILKIVKLNQSMVVEKIEQEMQAISPALSCRAIRFQIMWLLKQGLLELVLPVF